jgi:hypothetical protein
MDGWLLKSVQICGSVEDSIASWTLTKCKNLFVNYVQISDLFLYYTASLCHYLSVLYSSNMKLQVFATDFWDSILSLDEVIQS